VGNREQAIQFYNSAAKAYNEVDNPQRLNTAYQLFSSACQTDPTWQTAWFEAGNINSNLEKYAAAVALWRVALECEQTSEERAKVLVNLGWRLHSMTHTREALQATLDGLELDPNLSLGYVNLSMINQTLCNGMAMLEAARKAHELTPDDLNTHVAMAFAHLFNGFYAEGLQWFEARYPWRLQQYVQFPYPKWEGEPGKTVFIDADQGMGDTLSFSRFIEPAAYRAKYLHVRIQPPLYRLFQHAFGHLKNVNLIPKPSPFPPADYWTTFMSIPYALRLTDDQIVGARNIAYPRIRIPTTWKIPDRKLHIGISWSGSPLNDINRFRNIPVEMFFELYRVPGIALYSFQKDDKSNEVFDAGGTALVRDLTPYISDVVDTVSLLRELDMVICVESALGHIAALADVECWHPYSYAGKDWRLGMAGEQMLWRPKSHRTFLQRERESWQPVFDRIVEALGRKVDALGHEIGDGRRQAGTKAAVR
jgi:hypothetical protein